MISKSRKIKIVSPVSIYQENLKLKYQKKKTEPIKRKANGNFLMKVFQKVGFRKKLM